MNAESSSRFLYPAVGVESTVRLPGSVRRSNVLYNTAAVLLQLPSPNGEPPSELCAHRNSSSDALRVGLVR